MKQKWSPEWKSSTQPRKQRKYVYNAPLHVRHKFMGARLSDELTRQYGRRSLPVRKGDEIMVMRGSPRGMKGTVERIDLKRVKVYVDGITAKKVDGSEVMKPLRPSNLMITKANAGDKKRQAVLDRTARRPGETRPGAADEKPKEQKKEGKEDKGK